MERQLEWRMGFELARILICRFCAETFWNERLRRDEPAAKRKCVKTRLPRWIMAHDSEVRLGPVKASLGNVKKSKTLRKRKKNNFALKTSPVHLSRNSLLISYSYALMVFRTFERLSLKHYLKMDGKPVIDWEWFSLFCFRLQISSGAGEQFSRLASSTTFNFSQKSLSKVGAIATKTPPQHSPFAMDGSWSAGIWIQCSSDSFPWSDPSWAFPILWWSQPTDRHQSRRGRSVAPKAARLAHILHSRHLKNGIWWWK